MADKEAVSKGFADWYKSVGRTGQSLLTAFEAGWSACETAMNRDLGIAANEANKDQRLVEAMGAISHFGFSSMTNSQIREIVRKAQG